MSGGNVECTLGNQMGEYLDVGLNSLVHGAGEMKLDVQKDSVDFATCIATEVVNEILENALDIATLSEDVDSINFSVREEVCLTYPKQPPMFGRDVDDFPVKERQIKEIVEGLGAIRVPTTNDNNAEEPPRLDAEMKKLLNEMMSPTYEIDYETAPRKDGVGDQAVEVEEVREDDDFNNRSEDCLVDADKIKVVEKKTRVTDLVMNSKQVLTELLMSEETRNKQAEWEERNETVLQVIELDCIKPEEGASFKLRCAREKESDVVFTPVSREECLVTIDLTKKVINDEEIKEKSDSKVRDDRIEDVTSLAGSSYSTESNDINKDKFKNKFENLRKKWNINFKIFAFGKRRQKQKKEEKANI